MNEKVNNSAAIHPAEQGAGNIPESFAGSDTANSTTANSTSAKSTTNTPNWNLDAIVSGLRSVRQQWRAHTGRNREPGLRELPSRDRVQWLVNGLAGALFPMRLGPQDLREESEDFYVGHTLDAVLNELLQQVRLELLYQARHQGDYQKASAVSTQTLRELFDPGVNSLKAERFITDPASTDPVSIVRQFASTLPALRQLLDTDVLAAFHGDPAARSVDEVLLCYPGISAITHHRLAHTLYQLGLPLLARMVAELAHSSTGIDIHPGAKIGGSFFIDHGTGVVIGETAVIGERVRIYQAVTLGAKSFPADLSGSLQKGQPRHPIVEDDVVIYAGATVLGRITLGRRSVIGGNVWLTRSIPPHSNITQANSQKKRPDSGVDNDG